MHFETAKICTPISCSVQFLTYIFHRQRHVAGKLQFNAQRSSLVVRKVTCAEKQRVSRRDFRRGKAWDFHSSVSFVPRAETRFAFEFSRFPRNLALLCANYSSSAPRREIVIRIWIYCHVKVVSGRVKSTRDDDSWSASTILTLSNLFCNAKRTYVCIWI